MTTLTDPFAKPRRPLLAASLSLLGGPVGQIYAGSLGRSVLMWLIGSALLPSLAFASISLPIGKGSIVLILLCLIGPTFVYSIDAYFLARRRQASQRRPYQRWWFYLLAVLVFGTGNSLVATLNRYYVAEAFVVPTRGMMATILPGDQILVDHMWFRPGNVRRGDIVVFRTPEAEQSVNVMRVVGLPNDQIEVMDEKVVLNGQVKSEPYVLIDSGIEAHPEIENLSVTTVPSDSVFVLGDNRRLSRDSRFFGPVPIRNLTGRATAIYWSRERFRTPADGQQSEWGEIRWDRIGQRLD